MQRPKTSGLLDLMAIHAGEDIGEEADGPDKMWSLVEHHAFGALRHSSVGRLGPTRQSVAHQIVENLCRPDHGNASRPRKATAFLLESRPCGQIQARRPDRPEQS